MLIASHVDDLLWACEESAQWVINDIIKTFKCGEVDKRNFRYCGKEISQADCFSITVKCSNTTRNIKKIHIKSGRHPGDQRTDADRTQLKSVAGSSGSLSWVSRQCRPDLAYRVSRIQSSASMGTVSDLKEANNTVRTHDVGLIFKSNVLDWEKLMCLVVTHASHANESEEMIGNGAVSIEAHRSQGAKMICLASQDLWNGNKGHFHPMAWSSNVVRRVCCSTIQAEAYTLQSGIEDGDRIRAAVTDLHGKLSQQRWEASSAKFMKPLWLTDCKSLEETLLNPKCNTHSDKRLSIEIAALRQSLWRKKCQSSGDLPTTRQAKGGRAHRSDKMDRHRYHDRRPND